MANLKSSESSEFFDSNIEPSMICKLSNDNSILDDNEKWLTEANLKVPKSSVFSCEICGYSTVRHSQYIRHLSTDKHKLSQGWLTVANEKVQDEVSFECTICGKQYKHSSSLSKHKKKCVKKEDDSDSEIKLEELTNVNYNYKYNDDKSDIQDLLNMNGKDLIMTLLNENKDFKNMIIEQSKTMMEQNKIIQDLACRVGNNNNNINSHNNNTFNLQVFLNETCKDAINLSDFVENIKLSIKDLETTGRVGYVEGISNIIINNLNDMSEHTRPIHCADLKRQVLYVKNEDQWIKETEDNPILAKAIKMIANENSKNISVWRDMNPGCTDADSKKNTTYLNIVSNSMPGITKEECSKNIGKIISRVAKEVTINKKSQGGP